MAIRVSYHPAYTYGGLPYSMVMPQTFSSLYTKFKVSSSSVTMHVATVSRPCTYCSQSLVIDHNKLVEQKTNSLEASEEADVNVTIEEHKGNEPVSEVCLR